jgi:hypothetical protein
MFGFMQRTSDFVEIQVQEGVSGWRTIHSVSNDPNLIFILMDQIANQYPQYRVRAVEDGRIVDII